MLLEAAVLNASPTQASKLRPTPRVAAALQAREELMQQVDKDGDGKISQELQQSIKAGCGKLGLPAPAIPCKSHCSAPFQKRIYRDPKVCFKGCWICWMHMQNKSDSTPSPLRLAEGSHADFSKERTDSDLARERGGVMASRLQAPTLPNRSSQA